MSSIGVQKRCNRRKMKGLRYEKPVTKSRPMNIIDSRLQQRPPACVFMCSENISAEKSCNRRGTLRMDFVWEL